MPALSPRLPTTSGASPTLTTYRRRVPVLPGRVGAERLTEMAVAARSLPYSYAEVGATRQSLPDGYRVDRYTIDLGRGPTVLSHAAEGLRGWQAHLRAGVRVAPDNVEIEAGATVTVAVRVAFLTAVAPCRIVYVVDEADRFGFAYGTLAGHPERGEESFVVSRAGDRVTFDIIAFSRPASALARIGSPIARTVQRAVTRRYLTGLASYVESV
jgi:uncharacterized protein (UPF0548 family)